MPRCCFCHAVLPRRDVYAILLPRHACFFAIIADAVIFHAAARFSEADISRFRQFRILLPLMPCCHCWRYADLLRAAMLRRSAILPLMPRFVLICHAAATPPPR